MKNICAERVKGAELSQSVRCVPLDRFSVPPQLNTPTGFDVVWGQFVKGLRRVLEQMKILKKINL